MRYASIRKTDVSNGLGIGISLFVQGCHFHCYNCFNQCTWDFNGGKEWNNDIKEKFLSLLKKDHIQRVSILGGEPLADENVSDIYSLIYDIRDKYPNKKIWMFSCIGYLHRLFARISSFVGVVRLYAKKQAPRLPRGSSSLPWQTSNTQ